jgi:hypothetical protein
LTPDPPTWDHHRLGLDLDRVVADEGGWLCHINDLNFLLLPVEREPG